MELSSTYIYTLSLHDALPICFGQKKTLHVKLGEPAAEATAVASTDEGAAPSRGIKVGSQNDKLGISVSPVSPEFAQQARSEEHTSELQSLTNLVCRLLLEKKK